jgi:hypothetical protein
MVGLQTGITDIPPPNLLGLALRHCELEMKSDRIAQLILCKQVLSPDVLTRVTIGKYATGLICNNNCTNFLNRLKNVLVRLTSSAIGPF